VVLLMLVVLLASPSMKDKNPSLYISAASPGFMFIVSQIYSRLKERRDAMRKRAHDLFLEWHSKDLRESRTFVSRWLKAFKKEDIPALSVLEDKASQTNLQQQKMTGLYDPNLQEQHFFAIYQFFERWAMLIKNNDIDRRAANGYMSTYKNWYLKNFILHWYELCQKGVDTDPYLKGQLALILRLVADAPMKVSEAGNDSQIPTSSS